MPLVFFTSLCWFRGLRASRLDRSIPLQAPQSKRAKDPSKAFSSPPAANCSASPLAGAAVEAREGPEQGTLEPTCC
eukprot:1185027-Prorocentrum_minimum.AAC.1